MKKKTETKESTKYLYCNGNTYSDKEVFDSKEELMEFIKDELDCLSEDNIEAKLRYIKVFELKPILFTYTPAKIEFTKER